MSPHMSAHMSVHMSIHMSHRRRQFIEALVESLASHEFAAGGVAIVVFFGFAIVVHGNPQSLHPRVYRGVHRHVFRKCVRRKR